MENSREAAVSQLNREAFNLAASAKDRQAKDEKRRKEVWDMHSQRRMDAKIEKLLGI